MEPIIIKSKIDQKKYIKLVYILTYKKPIMIWLSFIGGMMFILSLFHFLGLYDAGGTPYFQAVIGFFAVIWMPFLVYRSANKSFRSSPGLNEDIQYYFDSETMKVTGESFNSEMALKNIFKVVEMKEWVLIYQNKQVANIISKKGFSEMQLISFRQMIKSLPDIKSKLKR